MQFKKTYIFILFFIFLSGIATAEVKKIFHLTDLHIGYKESEKRSMTIAKYIVEHEDPKTTIITITGDILDDDEDQRSVRKAYLFIQELKKAGFWVLLCPGNHDYNIYFSEISKKMEFSKDKFLRHFMPEVEKFPQLTIIDNVAFIALDSNNEEAPMHDYFLSKGKIGKDQLYRLKKILARPELKNKKIVVLLHHDPFGLEFMHFLVDNDELKKIIGSKVDMVLCGHSHQYKNYNGSWNIKSIFNGGSSTGKPPASFMPNAGEEYPKTRIINLPNLNVEEIYPLGKIKIEPKIPKWKK